jgi:hypothetical protein
MHRSSDSVAAIATALAKAQTELSNPEKAMVGTDYNVRTDSPQSFRYASLSSGLDIVRKTLGGQRSRLHKPPRSIDPAESSRHHRSSRAVLAAASANIAFNCDLVSSLGCLTTGLRVDTTL